MLVASLGCIWF